MTSWRVLIAVAPNGARRGKADHPAIPLTAAELAKTAAACADAGAAMIHVHVRNGRGEHVLDAGLARATIAAIRAEVGDRMTIQLTSEAAGRYARAEQIAFVRHVRPEAVSLALRELCPDEAAVSEFGQLAAWLAAESIAAQHLLYDAGDVIRLAALVERGVVAPQPAVLYVLGRYGEVRDAEPADLLPLLAAAAGRFPNFMVCAFGSAETRCVTAATLLGGNVRVGFENNLRMPDGGLARDNAALVAAVVAGLSPLGLSPVTAADARARGWC